MPCLWSATILLLLCVEEVSADEIMTEVGNPVHNSHTNEAAHMSYVITGSCFQRQNLTCIFWL